MCVQSAFEYRDNQLDLTSNEVHFVYCPGSSSIQYTSNSSIHEEIHRHFFFFQTFFHDCGDVGCCSISNVSKLKKILLMHSMPPTLELQKCTINTKTIPNKVLSSKQTSNFFRFFGLFSKIFQFFHANQFYIVREKFEFQF